jgi:tetratricopeptide (TPR) repeat protein
MFYTLTSFFILLLIGLGCATYIRNMAWASEKTLWEDAMAKAPGMTRPLIGLAWGHYEKIGHYEKALELYKKALHLKAHSIYHRLLILSNIAKVYYNTKRYRQAVNVWIEAIDAYPGHKDQPEMHYGLALAQSKLGDWEKAFANIDIAVSERPDHYKYLNLKGFVLMNKMRLKESLACFKRSLEFRPDYSLANENMGICLGLMGRYERGEWFLRKVHADYPRDIVILLRLIEVNLMVDDKQDIDLYADKLFAFAGANAIISFLRSVLKDNLMSLASRERLILEMAVRIKGETYKIAGFGKHPMD